MHYFSKKSIFLTILIIITFFAIPFFSQKVNAEDNANNGIPAIKKIQDNKYGADELGYNTTNGATTELPKIRNGIVKTILSFLGIFFLVLTIWGGYDWMFSGGNEERVTKAKNRIKNALYGLIIVLTAYLLSSFILDAIFKNTVQK